MGLNAGAGYRDAVIADEITLFLPPITGKLGGMPSIIDSKIQQFPKHQIERLDGEILEFTRPTDLETWLYQFSR